MKQPPLTLLRQLAIAGTSLAMSGCPDDPNEPINITVTATETLGLGTGGPGDSDSGLDETGDGGPLVFPGDPLTFHIEESTDFTNNGVLGCANADLNQVGDWLVGAFQDHGFVGTYNLNAVGTAYNFLDPNQGGVGARDNLAADNRRVTIYAGHGNVGSLQWGNPGPTPVGVPALCNANIATRVRLGTSSGDVSGFAMYVTSCTANTLGNNLALTLGQSQVGQHVGWHNSPAVSDSLPGAFVNQTATSIVDGSVTVPVTNRDAWLAIAQNKPGFGKNSPVIYTTGSSVAEVAQRHFAARLALGIGISDVIPEPQNPDFATISWVDNGCSSTCIGC